MVFYNRLYYSINTKGMNYFHLNNSFLHNEGGFEKESIEIWDS